MKLVKRLSLSILLILTLSTSLYSQKSSDTTRCFGVTKLKSLSIKLIKCKECDTLLKISDKQLVIKDSIINFKSLQVANLNKQMMLSDTIIARKDKDIENLTKSLNRSMLREKTLRFGCLGSGAVLVLLCGILLAR